MRNYLNPKSFVCQRCHKVISMKKKLHHNIRCEADLERKQERKEMRKMMSELKRGEVDERKRNEEKNDGVDTKEKG